MREYDENIRLFTPIMQRIIILVAVIIAVPVVLWTITAFVRAYVAPPTLPTFRPMAANTAPQKPLQVAAQTANRAIATDARAALLEIKKPAASDAPQSASAMSAPSGATPSMPAPATGAAASPVATIAAPVIVPPPPFAAARAASTTIAAPTNVALANVAQPVAADSPGPVASVPGNFAPDNQPAAAAALFEQTASNDSTTDDLPAGTPLAGKIPLPLRRPNAAALTLALPHDAPHGAAHVALAAGPMPAGIPLPRARPASAPEPAPVEPSYPAYDPSQIH
jgi:hypothetical protein